MVKKLVVGLDGSPLAEAALPYAEVFARANQAAVVLVRVARVGEMPEEPPEEPVPSAAPATRTRPADISRESTVEQREVYEAERYLHAVAERLRSEGLVTETVVAVGEPAIVLVEEAQTRQAEVLILSTHGRSGFGRWIYGSVADQVMRRSSVPVLLVPPACRLSWPRDRPPRILVPLDGSELARDVLAPAEHLAEALGAEIVLLRVVEPPLYSYAYTYPGVTPAIFPEAEAQLEHARGYLGEVAASLGGQGRSVATRDMYGTAASTILDVAEGEPVDLIVMATHGSGGVTRLLMGSVATSVVQRTRVPVVIVRPAAVRDGDVVGA